MLVALMPPSADKPYTAPVTTLLRRPQAPEVSAVVGISSKDVWVVSGAVRMREIVQLAVNFGWMAAFPQIIALHVGIPFSTVMTLTAAAHLRFVLETNGINNVYHPRDLAYIQHMKTRNTSAVA
jgi:hypothetical protein